MKKTMYQLLCENENKNVKIHLRGNTTLKGILRKFYAGYMSTLKSNVYRFAVENKNGSVKYFTTIDVLCCEVGK